MRRRGGVAAAGAGALAAVRAPVLAAFLAAFLALFTPGPAAAAAPPEGAAAADAAEQRFVEAMAGSPDDMAVLLAEDFVYLTTAGTAIGKHALLAHLRSGRTVVLQARREPGPRVERDGVVVSSGVLQVRVRQDGAERDIRSRYLHVWARMGAAGGWQLLVRQATELPPGSR